MSTVISGMTLSGMEDKVVGKPILLGKHFNCGGKVYFVKLDSMFHNTAECCMKCKGGIHNPNDFLHLPLCEGN